jgi:hypothetical protein
MIARINRRETIPLLGGAAAWPLAAWAQQGDRMRRIGLLLGGDENDPEMKRRPSVFTQALSDLGWNDGRNMRMDVRWFGDDVNRSPALAHELVGLQPDVIVTMGTVATLPVQRETRTIPIVFMNVGDPVAGGIVPRLNQPEQDRVVAALVTRIRTLWHRRIPFFGIYRRSDYNVACDALQQLIRFQWHLSVGLAT